MSKPWRRERRDGERKVRAEFESVLCKSVTAFKAEALKTCEGVEAEVLPLSRAGHWLCWDLSNSIYRLARL